MTLQLGSTADPRNELEAAGLWTRGTPLKLVMFGGGAAVPGYISVDSIESQGNTPSQVLADPRTLQFPQLTVDEIVILDGLTNYDPAFVVAFLFKCASWITIGCRLSVRFPIGRWTYPGSDARHLWTIDPLVSVLDSSGILVDHYKAVDVNGEKKITVSGCRPQRNSPFGIRRELLYRLIAGPLCSLGCVAESRIHEFYARCMSNLGETAAHDMTPGFSIHAPSAKPDKLRILHTVEFYAPRVGGAELVVKNLSERLAQRGHSVTVATSYVPERTYNELNGVHIEQFKVKGSSAINISGPEVPHYYRFLREFPCDVMMNYAAQQWATDIALEMIPRLQDRVCIVAPCGYSAMNGGNVRINTFFNYFTFTVPRALVCSDRAVYHSAAYQDYLLSEKHGIHNHEIIPNAVDEREFENGPLTNFREKYGITEKHILLCVANFLLGKGQDKTIEAFRQLNRPDTTLVLIGRHGETLAGLQEKAKGLNVRFLVDIPRADTISAYFASDLFVFTSEVEASPLVILEAKAARLPFVSTDVGNVREWSGGLVTDLESIPRTITRLLDDGTQRRDLGVQGRNEYEQKFTWSKVADRYEDLYLRLHFAKQRTSGPFKRPLAQPV